MISEHVNIEISRCLGRTTMLYSQIDQEDYPDHSGGVSKLVKPLQMIPQTIFDATAHFYDFCRSLWDPMAPAQWKACRRNTMCTVCRKRLLLTGLVSISLGGGSKSTVVVVRWQVVLWVDLGFFWAFSQLIIGFSVN